MGWGHTARSGGTPRHELKWAGHPVLSSSLPWQVASLGPFVGEETEDVEE